MSQHYHFGLIGLNSNMLCFVFFKLYLACYSKEKRDVVSLYIALLSCAREGIRVKERITVCLPSGEIKNRFLLIDDSIGTPHFYFQI